MNTDKETPPHIPLADLEALSVASSIEAFSSQMRRCSMALELPHFVVVRFAGVFEPSIVQRAFNAPASAAADIEDLERLHQWPLLREMRQGMMPVAFSDGDLPGFTHGVAAVHIEPRGRVVVVLGRDGPELSDVGAARAMGMAMLAVAHASISLNAIHMTACPFPDRELDCLRYMLADLSAKETARKLGLSFRTVEEYLLRARERFNVGTSFAAAQLALDNGWITLDQVRKLA